MLKMPKFARLVRFLRVPFIGSEFIGDGQCLSTQPRLLGGSGLAWNGQVHRVVFSLGEECASVSNFSNGPGIDTRLYGGQIAAPFGFGRKSTLLVKRAIDIVGAGFGLVMLSPLLLITALLIKIGSKGPVLFKQSRVGLGGDLFVLYKFRSMYVEMCDSTGVQQTIEGDPRITPIGKVIRRTSIDELPQLINVLRGDMSLIGPRPHPPGMLAAGMLYEELVPYYYKRCEVRPGLSGLAQISGCRGPTSDAEKALARIDYDIAYIRDLNVWTDLKIICLTFWREFFAGSGF